jgi:hypothetical protein
VLARRGGPVDEARGTLRATIEDHPTLHELVRCLVEPYAALLDTEGGRAYLQIVAQLRGRFAAWRLESDAATTKNLARILEEIEQRPTVTEPIRQERVVALIMLMTASTAERARAIDLGAAISLDGRAYVDNLVGMCAALILAPGC